MDIHGISPFSNSLEFECNCAEGIIESRGLLGAIDVLKNPTKWLKSALLILLALVGCDQDDAKINFTISPGEYTRSEFVCGSTNNAPTYPNHTRKATLGAFDDLEAREISLTPGEAPEEIYQTADCQVSIQRAIFTNEDGLFSFKLIKTHNFQPAGCLLTVTVAGETLPIDPGSALFTDMAEGFEDLRYQVTPGEGGTYQLETLDQEPINQAWKVYGCAASDTIRFTLTPRKPN